MANPVRVMLELGKKKRVVACAFDWPGWDRSARLGGPASDRAGVSPGGHDPRE
jgi:hypothetical protein